MITKPNFTVKMLPILLDLREKVDGSLGIEGEV
jgi:hypothetical protein